jgi:hypothetical protein
LTRRGLRGVRGKALRVGRRCRGSQHREGDWP